MNLTKIILMMKVHFGLSAQKKAAHKLNPDVGLRYPGLEAQLGIFWCWLNESMSRTSITTDLEAIKSKWINRAGIRESETKNLVICHLDHNRNLKTGTNQ